MAAALRAVCLERLPPGLSYDEAYNNLLATRIALLPPPAYIPADFGKEPAHIVLIALLYKLVGQPFAEGGRIVSALCGVFNVGLLFLAARELFRRNGHEEATSLGLLSAAALAILHWHVHFSRVGMEHVLVPTFSTLAFYLFWLALNADSAGSPVSHKATTNPLCAFVSWRENALCLFIVAGAALGLCLYTYPSAYLTPFVIPLFWAGRWVTQRGTFKAEWRAALVYLFAAALVFAPHAWYFIQHPEWFMARPAQVAAETWSMPLQNLVRMIEGLVGRGDTNLRLNLPGRPALDVIQTLAVLFGIGYGLKQPRREGTAFALLWLLVMLLPAALSNVSPHFGRALGATPPLAILAALGWRGIGRSIEQTGAPRVVGRLIVALALLYSGARTVYDYFNVWANDAGMFTAFETGLRESSEYLAGLPPGAILSLSPTPRDAPIFQFYLGARWDRFKTFNGRRCVVFPYQPADDFFHVAIEADERQSLAALQAAFPSGQIVHQVVNGEARYAAIYRVAAGTQARLALEPMGTFAQAIELARPPAREREVFAPGETIAITLTWRALATVNVNYTSFVHLTRQMGEPPLAQEDAQPCDNSYPTTWWTPGEVIIEKRLIHLPPDLPAGDYLLSVGWYELDSGQRLRADIGGDSLPVATIRVK